MKGVIECNLLFDGITEFLMPGLIDMHVTLQDTKKRHLLEPLLDL
ncbi:MAG: hypothetical protein QME40_05255 [bacterium]|nr:hypothetical protein [bacterium]